jgi:Ca2+-binding RTX toxin-like protein
MTGVDCASRCGPTVWRRAAACGLIAAACLLVATSVTHAATLSVRPELGKLGIAVYEAARGERNDVRLSYDQSTYSVIVADPGAVITASGLCASIDVHTASCRPLWVPIIRLELGDGADRLTAAPGRGPGQPAGNNLLEIYANGGEGDDDLAASNALSARLNGGGGSDQLLGSASDDRLTDGDVTGTAGRDTIDGGPGTDHVSYGQRTASVAVDLADKRPDGEAHERDVLLGIEGVTGGAGEDRLAGDGGDNVLDGGPGRDLLIGRAGDDVLGFNVGRGAPYDLAGEAALVRDHDPPTRTPAYRDRVQCAEGRDVIWGRRASDFVAPACEVVVAQRRLPFVEPGGVAGIDGRLQDIGLPAYPPVAGSSLTYPILCSNREDWDHPRWRRLRCAGTVRLREANEQRRLLATGDVPRGRGVLTARLRLTALGRQLAARRSGVAATLHIRGEHVPTAAWSIRVKLPLRRAATAGAREKGSWLLPDDQELVRDDGVHELFALDGMLLYGRVEDGPEGWETAATRPWMRVIRGSRQTVERMPIGSTPVSVGRDSNGRVVAVLRRSRSAATSARWWLYDLGRDTARPLPVESTRGCVIESLAVWRGRIAELRRCGVFDTTLVLHEGPTTTRLAQHLGGGAAKLHLRKRSLAVVMELSAREQTVWRVLDRGRRCVRPVAGTVEENGIWAGLGSSSLTWAIAGYEFDGLRFAGLRVWDIELAGRCARAPVPRSTPRSLLPQAPIHGAYRSSGPAIDGRTLYYATDTAIHRVRLPERRNSG